MLVPPIQHHKHLQPSRGMFQVGYVDIPIGIWGFWGHKAASEHPKEVMVVVEVPLVVLSPT